MRAAPAPLVRAMSILPPYLQNAASASGEVIDYRDWQVPLGRRFRALKLWTVLRCYGRRGLQERIRAAVSLAQLFEEWVEADPEWEIVAPRPFSVVCFRLRGSDEIRPHS